MPPEVVTYWLDGDNRVARVGGAWNEFAAANQAEHLTGDAVVGLELREFIDGDPARMMLDSILGYVRLMDRSTVRAYRCDSPECRRWYEMTVHAEGKRLVRLDHRLVRTEPRPLRIEMPVARGVAAIVTRCSLCCRVLQGTLWIEAEELGGDEPRIVPVAYGVCPECATGTWLPNRMGGTER